MTLTQWKEYFEQYNIWAKDHGFKIFTEERFEDITGQKKPKDYQMEMTEEKQKQFEEAAKPLIKFLNDHCNPHTIVTVTCTDAEILAGCGNFSTHEFLRD